LEARVGKASRVGRITAATVFHGPPAAPLLDKPSRRQYEISSHHDCRSNREPTPIRFYGIDAPEKTQPFGKEATDVLIQIIDGQEVDLIPTEQKSWDRIIGTLCLGDTSVSREMVRRGYAWAYREYLGDMDENEDYCRFEIQARNERLGVWSLPAKDQVAPWEYRSSRRNRAPKPFTDYTHETLESCIAAIGKRPARKPR